MFMMYWVWFALGIDQSVLDLSIDHININLNTFIKITNCMGELFQREIGYASLGNNVFTVSFSVWGWGQRWLGGNDRAATRSACSQGGFTHVVPEFQSGGFGAAAVANRALGCGGGARLC